MENSEKSLEEQVNGLTTLSEDNEERLESDLLEKSTMEDNKTPVSLLDEYTELEKQKEQAKEDFKKFMLQNDEFVKRMNEFKVVQTGLEDKQSEIKSQLVEKMKVLNEPNATNGIFKATFVKETTKSTFDKTTFEKENKDLYNKYIKKSKVSAYVKVALEK